MGEGKIKCDSFEVWPEDGDEAKGSFVFNVQKESQNWP